MSKRMSSLGWQYSEKSRTRATSLGSSAWGQQLKPPRWTRALKRWGWSDIMMMTTTRTTTKTATSSQPHWWQQARRCVKCTLYPRENPMRKVLLLSPHYRQENESSEIKRDQRTRFWRMFLLKDVRKKSNLREEARVISTIKCCRNHGWKEHQQKSILPLFSHCQPVYPWYSTKTIPAKVWNHHFAQSKIYTLLYIK